MRFDFIALAAVVALSTPAAAHPDHDSDDVVEVTPEQAARSSIIRLVAQTKLPVSWTKATIAQTRLRTVKGLRQTVFTFRNPTEPNKARQTLFVVLDSRDSFVSADHVLK